VGGFFRVLHVAVVIAELIFRGHNEAINRRLRALAVRVVAGIW
jgi:hypothetical protein